MQYVNDDMDELFRRAAENYPLDTNEADWHKIATALEQVSDDNGKNKRRGKYKLLWLLLLLPFSLICTNVYRKGTANNRMPDLSLRQQTSTETKHVKNVQESKATESINNHQSKPIVKLIEDREYESLKIVERSGFDGNTKVAISLHSKGVSESFEKKGRTFITDARSNYVEDEHTNSENRLNSTPFPTRSSVKIDLGALSANNKSIVGKQYKSVSANPSAKRFYFGILGGIDASAVRFQKVQKVGNDIGLLLGYKISSRWSIEGGLFSDKKFYYTEGEYFNTSKVYLPPNSKITWISGNCRMWEIPVSLRYSFNTKRTTSWFASAGLSSYIMKKEDYDYNYYYNATGQNVVRNKTYLNASRHLFSVAQLSVGYNQKLGNIADLRIEPYLKYAIKGAGVGSLPLQSAGIHVGLTKKLF